MDTASTTVETGPIKREPKQTLYPIAEFFVSPQGEGLHTGTLFFFCRLAGCSVGKPYKKEERLDKNHPAYGLPMYTEKCTLYDGRNFPCDTDYRVKQRLTAEEILNLVPREIEHFCISGGEPLIHDLSPLIVHAFANKKKIHIETSGTIQLNYGLPVHRREEIWITVSPKFGALPEVIKAAQEIKLLVDENFDPANLTEEIINHPLVYIQPVNGERTISAENLGRVMEWQLKYPNWRISTQLHKVCEHFLQKRVL